MRCLNSPAVLNSLETRIIEAVPAGVRHVLVVNAGDGRLARAIQEKIGAEGVVSVVTLQPGLTPHIADFKASGSNPWDLAWYSTLVSTHGAFDYVVLYQLHEFWRGELFQLQRLVYLARPGATIWASFFNAQAQRLIARFLPPVRLGYWCLADPIRCAVNLDFASYLDFAGKAGAAVTELWGMLDQNAEEFCQKQPGKPAQWESRGIKVTVGTFADAYLWGAAAVGVAFQTRGGAALPASPKITYSPYSSNLLQALTLPYPDHQTTEGVLAAARFEIDAWRSAPAKEAGSLTRFLIEQIGGTDKAKRILVVGSGWGRELLVLKQQYPAWDWTGVDRDRELVALGADLVSAAGVSSVAAGPDGLLPFGDRSFDAAVSLGAFSTLYEPAAKQLAKEVRRVTSGGLYHLEDGRGPDQGMQFKTYSLKAVYSELGCESTVQPVLVDGSPVGMYMLNVAAPA